jgi:hypothetical protein
MTGKCGCTCPDTTVEPPFRTLAECRTACEDAPAGPRDAGRADAKATSPVDASACASLETDIVAEWAKVGECQAPVDCATAYNNLCASSGPIIGDVGCVLPVNRNADVTRLSDLEQRYVAECGGEPGTCDCNTLPLSTCVGGHCKIVAF